MEIATRSKAQHKGNNRATYVLVPGGWHGSRCWKRGRKALQDAGHEVFTPSLTGVCERSYLNSATVNLSTHIADVVNPSPVGGTLGCDSLRPLLRWFRDQRRRGSNPGPDPVAGVSRCFCTRRRRMLVRSSFTRAGARNASAGTNYRRRLEGRSHPR
jgi:hypothetical protein